MLSEQVKDEVVVWAKWVVVGVVAAELGIQTGLVSWRVVGTLGALALVVAGASYLREMDDPVEVLLLEGRSRSTARTDRSLLSRWTDRSLPSRWTDPSLPSRFADSSASVQLNAPAVLLGLVDASGSEPRRLRYQCLSCEAAFSSTTADMSEVACPECDARRIVTVSAERTATATGDPSG